CLCKVDIKPWLFSKRKGSKSLEAYSCKIDIYWDLSSAKFGSGPEPFEGFYVAVVVDRQMVLILGDMRKEAFKKTGATPIPSNAVFVAKREHVFGKKVFCTKARFCDNGHIHDLVIECDTIGVSDPCLLVRVDCKTVMQVKRLRWKFRGNHTILVDGLAIEVFWDVHNWLFGASVGNAVFMFKTCTSSEKLRSSQPLSDPNAMPKLYLADLPLAGIDLLVMQLACFLERKEDTVLYGRESFDSIHAVSKSLLLRGEKRTIGYGALMFGVTMNIISCTIPVIFFIELQALVSLVGRRTVIIPCVKDLQEVIALQDFSGVYQSLITPTFILSFVIILCSVVVALPSEVGCVSEIIYDENK
ncbi:hypothetical protein D5086_009999, partial [Populus alba]